ncbi:MAG TPA: hypothetical protein VGI81_03260 [Tepidisphaeraceae bacterium]
MSVYKPDAAKDIAMEDIYIHLQLVSENDPDSDDGPRTDPLTVLQPGSQTIILGDPGSGKSTLLRFLSLVGQTPSLRRRVNAPADVIRLPIYVTLRRYADELKSNPNLSLLDHIVASVQAGFSLKAADLPFFEHYLESGQAIVCFDGLDELPNTVSVLGMSETGTQIVSPGRRTRVRRAAVFP